MLLRLLESLLLQRLPRLTRGVKKGRKIVGTRKGPEIQNADSATTIKRERSRGQGREEVQKYIDKQARKYAPKPKKQRTPRGGAGTPTPGKTVNYAEKQRRGHKIRKFVQKCLETHVLRSKEDPTVARLQIMNKTTLTHRRGRILE